MRLLFTGGGGAASEALTRLLPQHDVCFADAESPNVRVHEIPLATDRAFVPTLTALCRSLMIDLLIPGVDEELRPIAMHRQWAALPCEVLMPSYAFIGTHLDKLCSMKTLASLGIPVPQTWRRAMLKPREGRGSRDVKRIGHDDGLIVQELLEGQEYTVTMVADKQERLRAVVPVRVDLKRGVTLRGATEADADVIRACQAIHEAMPTSGVYNIQCIKADDSTVKPFEINPRVSTTTCLAIAAGVDVIGLFLDSASDVVGLAPFREMTLARSWQTEFGAVA